MKKIFFTLYLVSSIAHAFINLEPKYVGEVKKLQGEIGLDAALARGNTKKDLGTISTKIEYGTQYNKILTLAAYSYGQNRGKKDTNKGIYHLRYTHKLSSSYDVEFFGQIEFNEFQSIENRSVAGSNIRKDLGIFSKFFIGFGLMYSYLEPIEITENDTIKNRVKVNSYLMYTYKFNEIVSLNHLLFYQPNIEIVDDFTLFSRLQLTSKLAKNISFNVNVNYEYNSTPYAQREMQDVHIKAGLRYEF